MAAPSKRDDLIATALDLFAERGFHATGIDTILARAGAAKMTLYNHFAAKEDLIVAALERRDGEFRAWLAAHVEQAPDPRVRLLRVFDGLDRWFRGQGPGGPYRGCPFQRAAGEYADPAHPIHAAAARSKQALLAYLTRLAAAAGARNPEDLAGQLALLVEGAMASAQLAAQPRPALAAMLAARSLTAAALPTAA